MCGAAGAITVPSRISMNSAPATSSASPRSTRPVSFPPSAGAAVPDPMARPRRRPSLGSALTEVSLRHLASARLRTASGRRAPSRCAKLRRPDRRTAFSAAPRASPFGNGDRRGFPGTGSVGSYATLPAPLRCRPRINEWPRGNHLVRRKVATRRPRGIMTGNQDLLLRYRSLRTSPDFRVHGRSFSPLNAHGFPRDGPPAQLRSRHRGGRAADGVAGPGRRRPPVAAVAAGDRRGGTSSARSRESDRAATASAGRHVLRSSRRSCTWISRAATTAPPGPKTGAATAQSPRTSSPRDSAMRVTRTSWSWRCSSTGSVSGGGGVCGHLPLDRRDTGPGGEREQRLAERGRVRGKGGAGAEGHGRLCSPPLLHIRHVGGAENAQAGSPSGDLAQVAHDERRPFVEVGSGGGRPRPAAGGCRRSRSGRPACASATARRPVPRSSDEPSTSAAR